MKEKGYSAGFLIEIPGIVLSAIPGSIISVYV